MVLVMIFIGFWLVFYIIADSRRVILDTNVTISSF